MISSILERVTVKELNLACYGLIFLLMLSAYFLAPEWTEDSAGHSMSPVKSWIHADIDGENLTIRGIVTNRSDREMTITYSLEVTRTSRAGTSTSRQQGTLELAGEESCETSTATVNLPEQSEATVELTIRDRNENLLSSSRVRLSTDNL